jgi:carotenoid cleavage dioxygenase
MCFSQNYSILCDLATQFDADALLEDPPVFRNRTSKEPCRFALIPRYGQPEDVVYFEVARTFVLHFLNAYEEVNARGETVVVMDGYRQCMYDGEKNEYDKHVAQGASFDWKDQVPEKYHKIFPALGGMDQLVPRLWRWEFNLATGATEEGPCSTRTRSACSSSACSTRPMPAGPTSGPTPRNSCPRG